jgi:hypothetical protein
VLLVFALARLVRTVAAGLVPAACPILVCSAMPLVGSVWRLGALVAGGLVAISSIPGTNRPGCWRLAARQTRGQRRPTCTPWRCRRRAGLGVLYDQAEGNPDDGPE